MWKLNQFIVITMHLLKNWHSLTKSNSFAIDNLINFHKFISLKIRRIRDKFTSLIKFY